MAGGTAVSDRNRRRVTFVAVVFGIIALTGLVQFRHLIFDESNDDNKGSSWSYTGEDDPTLPKPWVDSAKTWWDLHNTLVQEVKQSDALAPVSNNDSALEPQLVFYGDSITESWRGTTFGSIPGPSRKWKPGEAEEVRQVFFRHFGNASSREPVKPPLVLGISGDQTQHLLWRMQNGEFPLTKARRIFIVLIGTNNLGGGTLPEETLQGINAVCRYILQKQKDAFLLLSELLPRFDTQRVERLCPPRCNKQGKPFESFLPAIAKVNAALPGMVQELRQDFDKNKIAVSSCGSIFTEDRVDEVMPDRLHPDARGHELWAECLSKHLSKVLAQDQPPLVLNNE